MANQRNFNRQYKHISGDFYDELEAAASLGQNCEISFTDEDGSEQRVISPIRDLFTENGVEFARLENRIIPLSSIISLNGKTVGGGHVHTDLLEQDRMPAEAPYFSPVNGRPPYGNSAEDTSPTFNTDAKSDTHDNVFKGNIGELGKTGIPRADNHLIEPKVHGSFSSIQPDVAVNNAGLVGTGTIHQNEVIEDNLLGLPESPAESDSHHAIIINTPDQAVPQLAESHHAHILDTSNQKTQAQTGTDDFVHAFTTSTSPFIVAESDMYQLIAHRQLNRVELIVKRGWSDVNENRELGGNVLRLAPLLATECSLLIDLTALTPDQEGTLLSPPIANKSALFTAGLTKVAELVPYTCDTLVHGPDSFSVNSVRLRYFKDRLQAESWLHDDPAQIGTPDNMDLN
jgi:hypothetical protein